MLSNACSAGKLKPLEKHGSALSNSLAAASRPRPSPPAQTPAALGPAPPGGSPGLLTLRPETVASSLWAQSSCVCSSFCSDTLPADGYMTVRDSAPVSPTENPLHTHTHTHKHTHTPLGKKQKIQIQMAEDLKSQREFSFHAAENRVNSLLRE